MNTQATVQTPSTKRRRRSRKRSSVVGRLLALIWPAQASLGRRVATWAVVVVLFLLSLHAGSMGLAYLQVLRVEHQIKVWHKSGKAATPASMAAALASIERANQLHPDNPYQLTLQASILEWRAYNGGKVNAEEYRQALTLHQQAAALRPLWPDSWAAMAQNKVRLGEFDADLDRYLARAHTLGPYTPAVHIALVQAGLPRLPGISTEQRELLRLHLQRGVQDPRSKGQVLGLVEFYGQQGIACGWMQQAEDLKSLPGICKS